VGGIAAVCRRPALIHSLWLLVLLKLMTPAVVPVSIPWPATKTVETTPEAATSVTNPALPVAAEPADAATVEVEEDVVEWVIEVAEPAAATNTLNEAGVWPATWWVPGKELLGSVWLTGSLVWLAWTGWHVVRFQGLLRYARPAPARLQE